MVFQCIVRNLFFSGNLPSGDLQKFVLFSLLNIYKARTHIMRNLLEYNFYRHVGTFLPKSTSLAGNECIYYFQFSASCTWRDACLGRLILNIKYIQFKNRLSESSKFLAKKKRNAKYRWRNATLFG